MFFVKILLALSFVVLGALSYEPRVWTTGKTVLVSTIVGVATFLYEPNVPDDVADYWILFLSEKIRRLGGVVRWLRGKSVLSFDFDPLDGTPAPPDAQVHRYWKTFNGVKAKVYDPVEKGKNDEERPGNPRGSLEANSPGLFFIHGGGWTLGTVDGYDKTVLYLTKLLTNFVVVSVEYRLAPQHPFPTPLDDVVAAYEGFIDAASELGVDPERIVVAGDSAGGNLAAALCLKVRDRNRNFNGDGTLIPPKLQVLIYPALQAMDFKTPSYQTPGPVLHAEDMAAMWVQYVTGKTEGHVAVMRNEHVDADMYGRYLSNYARHDRIPRDLFPASYVTPAKLEETDAATVDKFRDLVTNPYVAPLMADDVKDLPPAYVIACQYDVLRDDAIFYAHRLESAGVATTLLVVRRAWHGILSKIGEYGSELGVSVAADMVQFIRENV